MSPLLLSAETREAEFTGGPRGEGRADVFHGRTMRFTECSLDFVQRLCDGLSELQRI